MLRVINILVLCATYNRCDISLRGLRSIIEQNLPPYVNIQIAIVDDASTDGTYDDIKNNIPNVKIFSSTGNLYWAGAMRCGFSRFWDPILYSYLLVFNDDCELFSNAISELIDIAESYRERGNDNIVVVGSMQDENTGALTYGGLRRKKYYPSVYLELVMPDSYKKNVDSFNMNLVLISKECLNNNEFISNYFTHSFADYDFGLRVSKNNSKIILAPGFQGKCSRNDIKNTWLDVDLTFQKRLFLIQQPKGLPYIQRYRYLKYHAPYAWIFIFIWPYLKYPVLHFVNRAKKAINKIINKVCYI
jgi:GT2 family glycosyltransferase